MKLRGETGSVRERAVIERQLKHLVRLVDDLLDVSRITRGMVSLEKRSIGIAEVIANATEIASPLIEQRQHRLIVEVAQSGVTMEADPFRLTQVLSNLLANSAKFTDPGGTITISGGLEGELVVFRVKDTGIGIAPSHLPRVFDAFAQGA